MPCSDVVDRREAAAQEACSSQPIRQHHGLPRAGEGGPQPAKGLDELKAHSPVPADLKPKQKM
jgi:hypothetical protein